jgi:hypothetical protein
MVEERTDMALDPLLVYIRFKFGILPVQLLNKE